ncbi:hypothetical protein DFJ43DRAFT_1040544 [Lentinula guzmanii]|uniref:Uncharacterized protein n=1 Tax=Lentinula guzmanii TaxID=2804957 RepID=A0AA38JFN1_9AGAR|nr:hypothetical protein DFJ43DRAFT_1040544 [Lentinula guzmanii]
MVTANAVERPQVDSEKVQELSEQIFFNGFLPLLSTQKAKISIKDDTSKRGRPEEELSFPWTNGVLSRRFKLPSFLIAQCKTTICVNNWIELPVKLPRHTLSSAQICVNN